MLSRWARSTFAALSFRDYRVLWLGTAMAFLVFQMQWIAQSVVAFDLTGKNGAVGFVGLGMGLATITISPFGGVVADRVSKRKLLLLGQSTMGSIFLIVGVLILTDQISIILLAASTFIMGGVFSFVGPARQAWVGELLPPNRVANGMALTQVGMTGTRIVGPMLAGVLIAVPFMGTGGVYLIMGALMIVVVATLARLPASRQRDPSIPQKSVLGDLAMGIRHVRERPRLQLLVFGFVLVVMAGFSHNVLLPGFLEHELATKPERLWVFLMVSAVTGLGVTIGLAGIADTKWAWPAMLLGGVVLGGSLILLATSSSFFVACLVMLPLGAGMSTFMMLNNALAMRESQPAYYGRVMALTMLAWGFNGLVGLPVGLLADAVGERETLAIMGGLVIAIVAGSALIFSAQNARLPKPVAATVAPQPAADLQGGPSGGE